jgi:hypothetical protein
MGVRQGPETVFDQSVSQLLPELSGAIATKENGRVGNELVFWGYRLADGGRAFMFACAPLDNVDCAARAREICPTITYIVRSERANGDVTHRYCHNIVSTRQGDTEPGCTMTEQTADLDIGLARCQ